MSDTEMSLLRALWACYIIITHKRLCGQTCEGDVGFTLSLLIAVHSTRFTQGLNSHFQLLSSPLHILNVEWLGFQGGEEQEAEEGEAQQAAQGARCQEERT